MPPNCLFFSETESKKNFTYSILLFFLNVPYYVLYPKIIVNNWGGTSALLNCTLNARKIQTKCSIERFPLKEKWNNEWNIQKKKFNSKLNLGNHLASCNPLTLIPIVWSIRTKTHYCYVLRVARVHWKRDFIPLTF